MNKSSIAWIKKERCPRSFFSNEQKIPGYQDTKALRNIAKVVHYKNPKLPIGLK